MDDKGSKAWIPRRGPRSRNTSEGTGLIRPHGSDDTTVRWDGRRGAAELAKDGQPRPEQVANAFGSRIDESVTTDIHRIFRMPGTLHGNSGLLKMRVHDLQAFRPE